VTHLDRFVDVPGARLRVVVDAPDDLDEAAGSAAAPPITLVNSALVSLAAWDAMTPFLVAAGYRVVRYDYRGYGDSPAEDVEFSNRDDLRAVLDALGIERTAIAGNSYGAMIALDTILESPDRFVAFIWVGGGIGGFDGGGPTEAEAPLYEAYDTAEAAGDVDAMAAADVRIWVDGAGQPADRVASEIRETVRRMDHAHMTPGRVFGRRIPLEPPANDRLEAVAVPTLVIVGELDNSDTRAAAARLATTVPGARLESWPDVAHMIGMEQPERLARTIIDFLAPLPRWR
jgi:3-oxoadipate enol-lactonase